MKILETEHNGIEYRFELLEIAKSVDVVKGGLLTYRVSWNTRKGTWKCDCPGAYHHGYCWHERFAPYVCEEPSLTEPWTLWAEEARWMKGISNNSLQR